MGLFLRKQKSTRRLPLVFAGEPAGKRPGLDRVAEKGFRRRNRSDATLCPKERTRCRSGRLQDLRHRQDVVGAVVHAAEVRLEPVRRLQPERPRTVLDPVAVG